MLAVLVHCLFSSSSFLFFLREGDQTRSHLAHTHKQGADSRVPYSSQTRELSYNGVQMGGDKMAREVSYNGMQMGGDKAFWESFL